MNNLRWTCLYFTMCLQLALFAAGCGSSESNPGIQAPTPSTPQEMYQSGYSYGTNNPDPVTSYSILHPYDISVHQDLLFQRSEMYRQVRETLISRGYSVEQTEAYVKGMSDANSAKMNSIRNNQSQQFQNAEQNFNQEVNRAVNEFNFNFDRRIEQIELGY